MGKSELERLVLETIEEDVGARPCVSEIQIQDDGQGEWGCSAYFGSGAIKRLIRFSGLTHDDAVIVRNVMLRWVN